jgi:DNA-binding XRE family transcriptional regulator
VCPASDTGCWHETEVCHPVEILRRAIRGRYKAAKLAARASRLTVRVGDAPKGATEFGFGSALLSLARMGRRRPKRLAEKLSQIRKALGLSQKQMAERLGIHRTRHHISQYERGKAVPFMEVLLAYARLANGTIDQIIDDDQDLNLTL